ncbi:MAG: DUF4861 domain-containing protein [Prevotellaceae bacterium]|nr:DUF4861 domain-containing protein [Prevotellaceae bacterium]
MRRTALLIALMGSLISLKAQTYAQLKLWDSHERHPHINEIEFDETRLAEADSLFASLSTYDALYGHGAMMENEFYAIRVYMDARQSVDLYGKRGYDPELFLTDFYTTPELAAQGYGEDILFVGASIGAGSFRGYEDGKPSLLKPVEARGQRVLYNLQDSSAFEVWDKAWLYQGRRLNVREVYTMRLGRRDTQVDVWIEDCEGEGEGIDGLTFVTGAQKLEKDNRGLMLPESGIVASWGTNVPEKEARPDDEQTLGIMVAVPREYLQEVYEDELNYLCVLHPAGGHIRYYILAAADIQQEGGFHSAEEWLGAAKGIKDSLKP